MGITILAQTGDGPGRFTDQLPDPGSVVSTGGGSSWTGLLVLAGVIGLAWFMWRRRAGRRSAAALERVAETLDPSAPPGRYPRPPRGSWDRGGNEIAQAEAFLSAVARRCLGCGRLAGIPGAARPLVDICPSCEGRIVLALGDGKTEVML